MNKFLMLLFIIPLCAFSEIIHGTDTLNYDFNNNIVFSPHSLFSDTYNPANYGNEGRLYVCSASIPQIDIFVEVAEEGTCMYICHILAVGSPRPFYFSKTPFDSTKLSMQINLSDTLKFTKYDTIHANPQVHDTMNCYLPFLVISNQGNFGIFKNIYGCNILAKFDPVIETAYDTWNFRYYQYLKGYIITWYLQTNGSTDFTYIDNVKPAKPHIVSYINNQNNQSEYFNIRGQRILANKSCTGLLIERNDKGSFRSIVNFKTHP